MLVVYKRIAYQSKLKVKTINLKMINVDDRHNIIKDYPFHSHISKPQRVSRGMMFSWD